MLCSNGNFQSIWNPKDEILFSALNHTIIFGNVRSYPLLRDIDVTFAACYRCWFCWYKSFFPLFILLLVVVVVNHESAVLKHCFNGGFRHYTKCATPPSSSLAVTIGTWMLLCNCNTAANPKHTQYRPNPWCNRNQYECNDFHAALQRMRMRENSTHSQSHTHTTASDQVHVHGECTLGAHKCKRIHAQSTSCDSSFVRDFWRRFDYVVPHRYTKTRRSCYK